MINYYPQLNNIIHVRLVNAFNNILGISPFKLMEQIKRELSQQRFSSSFKLESYIQKCNIFQSTLHKAYNQINQESIRIPISLLQYKKISQINQLITLIFLPELKERKKLNQQRLRLLRKTKDKIPFVKGEYQHFIYLYQNIYYKNIDINYGQIKNQKQIKCFRTLLISLKKMLCIEKQNLKKTNYYQLNINLKNILRVVNVTNDYQENYDQNSNFKEKFNKFLKFVKNKWIGPRIWQKLIQLGFETNQAQQMFSQIHRALQKIDINERQKRKYQQIKQIINFTQKRYFQHLKKKKISQNDKKQNQQNILVKQEQKQIYSNNHFSKTCITQQKQQFTNPKQRIQISIPSIYIQQFFKLNEKNKNNKINAYPLYFDTKNGITYAMVPISTYKLQNEIN